MDHYVDIDFNQIDYDERCFLRSKIFDGIKRGIVQEHGENCDGTNPNDTIAVSFPQYNEENDDIGMVIRVMTKGKKVLERLLRGHAINRYLGEFDDDLQEEIREIPESVNGYAVFKRDRKADNKTNPHRKRFINKRNSIAMRSSSTGGRQFSINIKMIRKDQIVENGFGSYGLSSCSTVPLF